MIKFNSFSKYNQTSSEYLSTCDLINKYRLKTVYKKPKLKKIVVSFSLKAFINGLEKTNDANNSSLSEIKSFLMFYLYFSNPPFLSFILSTTNRSFEKLDSGDFIFKTVICNDKDLRKFLFSFWVDNLSRLKNNKVLVQQNKILKHSNSEKYLCFSFSVNIKTFVDFENILGVLNKDFDNKGFNLNINFIFQNIKSTKDINCVVKNIPTFWING